jgi:hypothetical protein
MKTWKSSEEVRRQALDQAEEHWNQLKQSAVENGLADGVYPNITLLGLDLLLHLFVETIRRQELRTHLEALEQRIEVMEEERKNFAYRGVWEAGLAYRAGNFVTDGGSVWHCKRTTTQRPGPGDAWQLAVKRGQDGRDLRS